MTSSCHRREPAEYPILLAAESERFIDVVYSADADLPIPTCPGWTATDIGEHVGQLYRWAAEHVRQRSQTRIPASMIEMHMPPERAERPGWVREGVEILSDALNTTDPDAVLWAWGSDKAARFWGRRMVFETTIHRADVELARGEEPVIDSATAIDGIDEFLDNLPFATYFAPKVENLRGEERLVLHADDEDVYWQIDLSTDGFDWTHDAAAAGDATVSQRASRLLLFVYGRLGPSDVSVEGDKEFAEFWSANSAI